MAQNGTFSISIKAIDKTTSAFDSVNARIRQMKADHAKRMEPINNLKKAVNSFKKITGITAVTKGIKNAFSAIAGVIAKMTFGIAKFGLKLLGLGGIASLAGIVELTRRFADFGKTLSNNAMLLGMNAAKLLDVNNAASLAGVSSGQSESAQAGFQDKMLEAKYRGGLPAQLAQALGLSGNNLDEKNILKIAKGLQGKTAAQKRFIMGNLGVSSDAFLLEQSPKDIKKYYAEAKKYGAISPSAIKNANKLYESFKLLDMQTKSLTYSLVSALTPVILPLVNDLLTWINTNKKLIESKVTEYVKDLVKWISQLNWTKIKDDAEGFWGALKTVAFWLKDNWKLALAIGAVAWFAGPLASALALLGALKGIWKLMRVINPSKAVKAVKSSVPEAGPAVEAEKIGAAALRTAAFRLLPEVMIPLFLAQHGNKIMRARETKDFEKRSMKSATANLDSLAQEKQKIDQTVNYFRSKGLTKQAAVGITAQIQSESNFQTDRPGDYVDGKPTAWGIGQWHLGRVMAILKGTGIDVRTDHNYQDQLKAMNWELHHPEIAALNKIMKAKTFAAAGSLGSFYYERPGRTDQDKVNDAANRAGVAQDIGSIYDKGKMSSKVEDFVDNLRTQRQAKDSTTHTTIEIPHAPPGTKIKSHSKNAPSPLIMLPSPSVGG